MLRRYVVQGIPLSQETRAAWREWGWSVLRIRTTEEVLMHLNIDTYSGEKGLIVMNAGMSNLTTDWWDKVLPHRFPGKKLVLLNPGEQIILTRRPGDLRKVMPDLLPPVPSAYPADIWVKGPGHGGMNKTKETYPTAPKLPNGWDIQGHVEGTEYRVVTVNDKVVQAFERTGTVTEREYSWVGVVEAPSAVKSLVKKGARKLSKPSVIAWDTILSDEGKAYILEANTAPGVNVYTVHRITDQVLTLLEGDQL